MRLLFDHNLSHKLVHRLADLLPDSTQTRLLGLAQAPDRAIWACALEHGPCIVTLDGDFADASILRGAPPKVIWLRCGHSTVAEVEALRRRHAGEIAVFAADSEAAHLEIWP
jgi:predicted nuclease of predicted toxin-antitoxin system